MGSFFKLKIKFTEYLKKILRKKAIIFIKSNKGFVIFDDIIPSNLSPWRSFEFSSIIKNIPLSYVYTDLKNFRFYNKGKTYSENVKYLKKDYPSFDNKIVRIKRFNIIRGKIAYTIFLFNIVRFFPLFSKFNIPFVFTLYPGGGFLLENDTVRNKLNSIFESDLFKGVLVNQFFVKEYLVEKLNIHSDKIKVIHGIPINIDSYDLKVDHKKSFNQRLRMVFFANKYSEESTNKGWDIFVELSEMLIKDNEDIEFDVIGGFTKDDIENKVYIDKFKFHGVLTEDLFHKVLNETHIIISPNSPNLKSGAFDGFPLATCVTAGLFYNALIMTDYFNEAKRSGWNDGEEFVKINRKIGEIYVQVKLLISNRNKLKFIACSGRELILQNYSEEKQIKERLRFFNSVLGE